MSVMKNTLAAALWAGANTAYACPCPDKPMSNQVLAPQVTGVDVVRKVMSPVRTTDPAENIPVRIPYPIPTASPAPTMPVLPSPELTQATQTETAQIEIVVKEPMAKSTNKLASDLSAPAKAYQAALQTHLSAGADGLMVFSYAAAQNDGSHQTIKDYVSYMTDQDPDAMSTNEAIAFWANLYNAVTLDVVLDNYPVSSIKKIGGGLFGGGPWKKKIVTVGGTTLSLDDIEHETLRKKYPSPYIHYMVNCASIGCPNLRPTLWQADTLDSERKKAASDYINSARGVSINGSKLTVSSIYDWFQEDFGGSKSGVLEHLKKHSKGDLKAAIDDGAKISGFGYDWNLNE